MKTSVSVDVELSELEFEDLEAELKDRGYTVFENSEGPDLSAIDSEDLQEELRLRTDALDLEQAFAMPSVAAWLRAANPPQEVRDAYWQSFGRIL